FLEILRFELRYYLRRISTWLYFGIFFLFAVFMVHLAGGAWDEVQMSMGGSGGSVKVNSPYVTASLTAVLGLFGVLVTAALLGNAVYRDFETGIYPLFFTKPVSRSSYLAGRLTGALLVNALIFAAIPIGLLLSSLMPYLDAERFGPVRLGGYLHPYLVFTLPNLLFTGLIFFSLAVLTRRMLPNYVGGAFMLLGYLMASNYLSDLDNQRLAALADPFGMGALDLATKYWTPAERNALLVPVDGLLLANRLLWVALAAVLSGLALSRFRMEHQVPERQWRGWRRRAAAPAEEAVVAPIVVPTPRRSFGFGAQLQQYVAVVRRSFWGVVGNRYFFAIVGGGVLYMVMMADVVDEIYGTTTWPVTYAVLEVLGGSFSLFTLIVITFYAGELVWAEREARIQQVVDATPVRSWVPLAGKWTALILMLLLMQAAVLVTGVVLQAVKGYYKFELGLYFTTLFGLDLLDLLLLTTFVVLVHVLVNHKYFGHLLVVAYLVFTSLMGTMGLEHDLYRFNSGSRGIYSDMNGWGPFLQPYFWLKGYWAAWSVLLAVLANLFWVRGEETGATWRMRLARLRFTRPAISAVVLAGVLILGAGGFVFYNTNVLNQYETRLEGERLLARYERTYKRYEGIAQPRIVGVRLHVEIYPEERDVTVRGEYRLRNRTGAVIDSIHLLLHDDLDIRRLSFDRPSREVVRDEPLGYHVFALIQPLQPGESIRLHFDLAFRTEGFANGAERLEVVRNGTFFNSGFFPSIGYEPQAELSSDDTRRKHGLPPRERMAPVNDLAARRNNDISRDADWIDFEATVGTSADQIALAPGYLQRQWSTDGRRYFHYRMDAPILNFYAFLSADYAVKRDRWKDVAIEIYYQPGHEYNIDRMADAIKKSLDYYTTNFGPYQHRQVRILEFPRYQDFAQSFPNTIPYSEGLGFVARVTDTDQDIDYPFYVTAHEVAHQWWGHQVVGGNVQGAALMSETLSQYSALMVMEKEYGRDQIRRFLEYELDHYLQGRAFERKKERPLLIMENQAYIHYNKGSLAMYQLRDHIGEARLNQALRRYLEAVKFQEPPYTNSLELYAYLRAATPDSLRYVLEDLFEHITLYDNRTDRASYTRTADGKYQVTMRIAARKLQADSLGNEREVPMRDLVDVGVFAPNAEDDKALGEPLYLRKHRLTGGAQTVRVTVDAPPGRAGIDPYHKLIDRNGDDNAVAVAGSRLTR
ncbi:MAG: hypothetical protein KY464_05700, partial [Gemmatimonadetes bacterium]|nr:hypothetical protein [Gemmatimonadota bacterium]